MLIIIKLSLKFIYLFTTGLTIQRNLTRSSRLYSKQFQEHKPKHHRELSDMAPSSIKRKMHN